MDPGYDPARVSVLSRHAAEALDALGQLGSTDPAAAEATRTVRLTRRNLEDRWMPALRDIERSDAMIGWRASQLNSLRRRALNPDVFPDHLHPGGLVATTISPECRAELLAELDWLERTSLSGDDAIGAPTHAELGTLAGQLALWTARDADFADELVELSVSNMLVGRLLGEAKFASSFASSVVRRMALPNGPDTGVDRVRYAASLSTALASVTEDPTACLELLLDKPTAYALAAWDLLDTDMLAGFVESGLHASVTADPRRLGDGYKVLTFLTQAANGPLDRGFNSGMALGVANSLPTYLDTLAPAIQTTALSDPMQVHDHVTGVSADFGTLAELHGLFGSIVRLPEARTALRAATISWSQTALVGARSLDEYDHTVATVSEFTSTVITAAEGEQAQVVAEDKAEDARNRQAGSVIAVGVNATLGPKAGTAGALIAPGIEEVAVWIGGHDVDDVSTPGLGNDVFRQMQVSAVAIAVARPTFFDGSNDHPLTDDERQTTTEQLRTIRTETDPVARDAAITELLSNVSPTPLVTKAVNSIKKNASAVEVAKR